MCRLTLLIILVSHLLLLCVCDDASTCSSSDKTCTAPSAPSETKSTASSEQKPDGMKDMFETDSAIETFFEEHFERSLMFVSHSERVDRQDWMNVYRRFIPTGGLNTILSPNKTASDCVNPLEMHRDLEILRVGALKDEETNTNEGSQNPAPSDSKSKKGSAKDQIYTWLPMSLPVDLQVMQEAVTNGAVLHIYDMDSRVRDITTFVNSMKSFWEVPISVTFSFHPPATTRMPGPAFEFSASDLFLISLDGFAIINTFDDFFPYPHTHHVHNARVRKAAYEDVVNIAPNKSKKNKKWSMNEGDILYIPRGTAFDVRTTTSLAVVLYVHIHTEQRLVYKGLEQAIDIARRNSEILDKPLPYLTSDETSGDNSSKTDESTNNEEKSDSANNSNNGNSTDADEKSISTAPPTWTDLLLTSVKVAAEFTPEMRRFLPITGDVLDSMDEAGTKAGETLVKDALNRFSLAASTALFRPFWGLLTKEDKELGDASVTAIAPQSILSWAEEVAKDKEKVREVKDTFKACIQDISQTTTTSADIVTSMSMDWYDNLPRRVERENLREKCLRMHGQPLPKGSA